MCRNNNQQKRVITSKQYAIAKNAISVSCKGEMHPNFGVRVHSDEEIERIRLQQTGEGNNMFGKTPWNKGKKPPELSAEHKKKISESLKGRPQSEYTKQRISDALKGKPKSDLHKKKISESLKGRARSADAIKKTADALRGKKQKIIICPHCNKSGGTTMHRWHFDNCKEKK